MEDLIGILVAVGIIVFKIWTGMKGETEEAAPTTTSQTDWEEEPFNPEEAEWTDETPETMRPIQVEEQPRKVRSLSDLLASLNQAPRPEKVKRVVPKPVAEAPKPVAPQPVTTKHPSHSIGQRLQSSQEARRAFIYSEIFRKKYN